MAKSGENFLTIRVLKEQGFSPLSYRYFLLQTHYRRQLNFSLEALTAASRGLEHFYKSVALLPEGVVQNESFVTAFLEHVNDDLDIPGALALTWEQMKDKKLSRTDLLWADEVFGLRLAEYLKKEAQIESAPLPPEVQTLIKARDQARTEKEWEKSDELRKKIEVLGYRVNDTAQGTEVTKNS